MRSFPTVSIVLHKNYRNNAGKYPVKIRVTYQRKSRYFKTQYVLDEDEFDRSYKSIRPRGEYKLLKDALLKIEFEVQEFIRQDERFSWEAVADFLYGVERKQDDVISSYQNYIDLLESEKRYGNARAYRYSLKSLEDFLGSRSKLEYNEINVNFLKRFDSFMSQRGLSKTTIGVYMRCLRFIINEGIRNDHLSQNLYPFGLEKHGKYAIPKGNNTKKALSKDELQSIANQDLSGNQSLEFCRDFWMISFYCGGINFADLLRLRIRDYNRKSISFIREKTKHTKVNASKTIIHLTDSCIQLIEIYRSHTEIEDSYLFSYLESASNKKQEKSLVDSFNNHIRKGMNKLSSLLQLSFKVGPIHARHSFANLSWNKKVPISYIANTMSHSSIKTTSSYLKSISDENKKETMDVIFEDFK
ncbi:tyrosine-type recombinase/integrase [Portibacter marinus]|uniref:tyrosine-type recombinase/integrase n=1 Tax=Portibacter marinus TaxID=2898660 RepID=UPI001F450EA8|nr:site-specific integrase [Portibacter marinus]